MCGAGATGTPARPLAAIPTVARKTLESQETAAASRRWRGGGHPPRQLSDVVSASACSSPPMRPFSAS